MAKGQNYLTRQISTKALIPDASSYVNSGVSFNQGDLIYFVPASGLLTNAPASGETGSNFLGISPVDVVSGILRPPYIGTDCDAAVGTGGVAGPQYGSVWKVSPKSGDTFTPGCKVYPSIAAGKTREVTVTSGSLAAIGMYVGGSTVVATSGSSDIECLIGAVYPNAVPHF